MYINVYIYVNVYKCIYMCVIQEMQICYKIKTSTCSFLNYVFVFLGLYCVTIKLLLCSNIIYLTVFMF